MRKSNKLMLVVVTQVIAAILLNTQALGVNHMTTTTEGLTTGQFTGPGSASTTSAPNVSAILCGPAEGGGSCYKAIVTSPYAFSYADTIMLPMVGQTFGGALADATFRATTETHENWHRAYIDALLNRTYGALEDWSASYESNLMDTEDGALALGNADLAAALTTALNAFTADAATDQDNPAFGHQNAIAVIENISGVNTYRSQNPDWGAAAVNYANAIVVTFAKGPGNCELVPEPGAALIFALGVVGLIAGRSRH